MVGEKKRSLYRKKRKSGGFVGAQKQAMNEKEASPDEHTESLAVGPNRNPGTQTPNQAKVSESSEDSSPVGTSRRKLSQHGYRDTGDLSKESEASISQHIDEDGKGYRFVDIGNLSSVLSNVHRCEGGKYLVFFV